MASRNFLLVSLEESKAKELAQIVSNDVCRRILDYLAAKESTETELSQSLGIPISTIHYNLQQLLKSGIVKTEEFHYSSKGREVLHYSLANKYIIIAPKAMATESLANKLKRILPVVAVVAAVGAVLQVVEVLKQGGRSVISETYAPLQQKAADAFVPIAREAAQRSVGAAATYAEFNASNQTVVVEKIVTHVIPQQQNIALWFVAGAAVAIIAMLIFDAIRSRNK